LWGITRGVGRAGDNRRLLQATSRISKKYNQAPGIKISVYLVSAVQRACCTHFVVDMQSAFNRGPQLLAHLPGTVALMLAGMLQLRDVATPSECVEAEPPKIVTVSESFVLSVNMYLNFEWSQSCSDLGSPTAGHLIRQKLRG